MIKGFAAGLAAAAALVAGAFAAQFNPLPSDYRSNAESYIFERLDDPRSAEVQFVGEPYQVFADVAGYEGLPCWAVDVRVKARLPGGGRGGFVPYTVLFLDGEAIALNEDARRLVRL